MILNKFVIKYINIYIYIYIYIYIVIIDSYTNPIVNTNNQYRTHIHM